MPRKIAHLVPRPLLRRNILHTLIRPFGEVALKWKESAWSGSGSVGVQRLDAVIVVNLASRPDRLAAFEAEAQRLHLKADRFEAISAPLGILGCTRSHAALMRLMIERDWTAMMVCEDDATFKISRRELDVLIEAFLRDKEAEVACLAFHLQCAPVPRNLLFFRARDTRTTVCYVVKRSIAEALLERFELGITELEGGGDRMLYGVDMIWKGLQGSRVFLIPTVRAVTQADGFSDIEERFVRYGV